MSPTKAQVVNDAFTELRISGLTVQPSPGNIAMALSRLESMMAELLVQWNMDIGYNFQATPTIGAQTNVTLNFKNMMVYNLAVRLIPAFNKQVPQELKDLASASLSSAISFVTAANMRQIQPSRRMPIGSGNTARGQYWDRFAVPVTLPPVIGGGPNDILQGETLNYQEDFSAFLGANTLASYTIVCDTGLTIVTSANADPLITYTITAPASTTNGSWQQVAITVTSSNGEVDIRIIDFQVETPPTIPAP